MIATGSAFLLSFSVVLSAAATDNAADDYVAAAKLYQEPDDAASEALGSWTEGSPAPAALATVLSDNRLALERLTAGTRRLRCDFSPDASAPGWGPDVPVIPLLKLGKLLVLRGRARRERGELEPAIADSLGAFRLVDHLGKTDSVVARATSATLEQFIVSMTEPAARTGKMRGRVCSAIRGHLESHLRQRPSAAELVELERRMALAMGESITGNFAGNPALVAACTREYRARVAAYFGPFSRYATSHNNADKTSIEEADQKRREELKTTREQIEALATKVPQGPGQDLPKLTKEIVKSGLLKAEEIPTVMAVLMMGAVVIDLTSPIETDFQATAAMEKLRSALAACR